MEYPKQYDIVVVKGQVRETFTVESFDEPSLVYRTLYELEEAKGCECFVRIDGEQINLNDEIPERTKGIDHQGSFMRVDRLWSKPKPKPLPFVDLRTGKVKMYLYPVGVE